MTAIFAVRHPQTTWNVEQRYQGRLEAPWSGEGGTQAKLVAKAFAGCDVAAVYSSPLQRALDLGREIARLTDTPVWLDQRLTEIGLGQWEGLYRWEIEAQYPDLFEEWYGHPERVTFPDGEDLAGVCLRVESALSDIFTAYPDGAVVAVTHSVVIQVLAACALGLAIDNIHRIRVANAGVTTLCGTEAPGLLISLNDTDAVFHSPLAAAAAQYSGSTTPTRMTA